MSEDQRNLINSYYHPSGHMRHFRAYFSLLILLLSASVLDISGGVRAQRAIAELRQGKVNVEQCDGWLRHIAKERQSLPLEALRSSSSSSRVASSRPARLLPTHGGKPTSHSGRCSRNESYNPTLYSLLLPCRNHTSVTAALSPRLRYVIALRHFLC